MRLNPKEMPWLRLILDSMAVLKTRHDDAARQFDFIRCAVVDAMPPDTSVPPEPDPIDNPLDLDHDALFQCDDGVAVQTAPAFGDSTHVNLTIS